MPNNVVGVYNVFEAARLAGVERMILASSGQVVWRRQASPPYPIEDDVAVTPLTGTPPSRCSSKLRAERLPMLTA